MTHESDNVDLMWKKTNDGSQTLHLNFTYFFHFPRNFFSNIDSRLSVLFQADQNDMFATATPNSQPVDFITTSDCVPFNTTKDTFDLFSHGT